VAGNAAAGLRPTAVDCPTGAADLADQPSRAATAGSGSTWPADVASDTAAAAGCTGVELPPVAVPEQPARDSPAGQADRAPGARRVTVRDFSTGIAVWNVSTCGTSDIPTRIVAR
jgi:hypothetical protein